MAYPHSLRRYRNGLNCSSDFLGGGARCGSNTINKDRTNNNKEGTSFLAQCTSARTVDIFSFSGMRAVFDTLIHWFQRRRAF